MQRARELYLDGQATQILVSGGTGKSGHNEAVAMRTWLLDHAVKDADILVDPEGNTTHATSTNAAQMLADKTSPVIGVSQWFHLARVQLSLENAGFTNVQVARPSYVEARDGYSFVRELVAVPVYLLRGR